MSVIVVSDSDVESEHKPAGAQVRSSAWLESARVERECEYRLVLDCLSAQRCTDEWVCEQSARVRASGGTVVLSARRARAATRPTTTRRAGVCAWRTTSVWCARAQTTAGSATCCATLLRAARRCRARRLCCGARPALARR